MKRYNLTNQFHGFHVIDYINHTNRNPGEAKAYNTKRKIKYNIKSNFVTGFQSTLLTTNKTNIERANFNTREQTFSKNLLVV